MSNTNIWPTKQQLQYNSFDVYHMKCNFLKNEPFMSYQQLNKGGRVTT